VFLHPGCRLLLLVGRYTALLFFGLRRRTLRRAVCSRDSRLALVHSADLLVLGITVNEPVLPDLFLAIRTLLGLILRLEFLSISSDLCTLTHLDCVLTAGDHFVWSPDGRSELAGMVRVDASEGVQV
jgi:hypothetical protein